MCDEESLLVKNRARPISRGWPKLMPVLLALLTAEPHANLPDPAGRQAAGRNPRISCAMKEVALPVSLLAPMILRVPLKATEDE